MNRIDYNQSGGFPLSTQVLDAAQEAYKHFNAFGNFAGDLAIITGCQDSTGGTVTDGFVAIFGELIPFVGTTKTANVVIVETGDQRGFEDGSVKSVIYSRYATFGEGPVTYAWDDFRRPMTLFALEDRLKLIEKAVPIGLVAIWGLPADAIPAGWVAHTDFEGTVPVARKAGDVNFGAALGTKIGTAQVTLSQAELPNVKLNYSWLKPHVGDWGGGGFDGGSNKWGFVTEQTSSLGSGNAHTNIQPSTIVDYIRFVGFE